MKLTKTAKGLSDQLAPVLEGVLDSIYRVTDAHKARMVNEQLKIIVRLAVKAKEANMSEEMFKFLLSVVDVRQASVVNGRIEFSAAVASGMETAEGKEFHVALTAGGSLAGFALEGEAGYAQDSRQSMYERSSQNMRIRLDFASLPLEKFDQLSDALAERIFAAGTEVEIPEISDEESSPILEALESYLPVIKAVFGTETE